MSRGMNTPKRLAVVVVFAVVATVGVAALPSIAETTSYPVSTTVATSTASAASGDVRSDGFGDKIRAAWNRLWSKVKPKTPTPGATPSPGAATPAALSAQQTKVVSLVNAARSTAGCKPVTADGRLTTAAQKHSQDMVTRNFFSHTNPDGKSPGDRIKAAGYPATTWAENISYGQSTAEAMMKGLMSSPGHRANIVNCKYVHIGVGVAATSSGTLYWTQDFGAS